MSAATSNPPEHELYRRKVHRNIHSCLECKRRKVRCQLSAENVAPCVSCLNRGFSCTIQQNEREESISGVARLDEKLGRIESLLEKFLENSSTPPEAYSSTITANQRVPSLGYGTYKASSASGQDSSPNRVSINKTSASLGNLQQRELSNLVEDFRRARELEKIRESLSALLPSQHDVDLIGAATNGWALAQVLCTQTNDLFKNDDPLSSFNLDAVSRRHPTVIARTLLYIVICVQQLPPEFDLTQLDLLQSPDLLMERYISIITDLVTSDDDLVTSIEGLECLLLQGLFHLNAGNLRRTWLSFRRALSVAQLMSLDKDFLKARLGLVTASTKAGKQMWHQVVMSDRYISLLLGLPCGAGDNCFGLEETVIGAKNEDVDFIFERRLSLIAGHISSRARNGSGLVFSKTQVIDEDLDRLAKEMPQSWWDIPILDTKYRSPEVAQQFNRLMSQMWYHQLQTLLHLPFMLRADAERRYEYSTISCLRASREILARYLALRRANNTQLLCRVVDFATFIASLTMILCLLQPSPISQVIQSKQREENMALLREIVLSMENLASSSDREVVAKQSVEVLRALVDLNENSGVSNGNLRLTIPYFGTISITSCAPIQCLDAIKSTPSVRDTCVANSTTGTEPGPAPFWLDTNESYGQGVSINSNPLNPLVISFASTQFPWLQPEVPTENSEWQGEDVQSFDSLLNSDIIGFDTF